MKSITLTAAAVSAFVWGINAQTNVLQSTGNAGIGTISPVHLLQLSGGQTAYTNTQTYYTDWEGVIHSYVAGTAQGYTAKFGLTNSTTGTTATDGSIFRQSGLSTVIENQEKNLLTLQSNRAFLTLSGIHNRVNVGEVNYTASTDACFNVTSQYDNGLKVVNSRSGYYGASIKVNSNTDNALLLYGTSASPSYTIKGSGITEVFYRSASNSTNLFTIRNNERKLFQLSNDGILRTREIYVDALNWADYVFEPSYPLMPLDDLKSYIGENGHLPNVPSTAEVEESGVNLAKTDAVLLEKIEELTLYILQQEERLKALETELQTLKTTDPTDK